MVTKYNPAKIERKWQKKWEAKKVFQASDATKKPKYYILVEFPYPSGDGLHVGHCRSYVGLDVIARKRRMEGFNVLFPMGWDAFGLPTENYALKTGIHPAIVTQENSKRFKAQQQNLGLSFDWSREINTTDPDYYKWTQWIFVQLFKKGLAYKSHIPINWCPACKIVLANEEVVQGKCERCGTTATHKEREQWMLKITEYADRLVDDLANVDYLDRVRSQQINWIGRSQGLEEWWPVEGMELTLKTFTTWPHTSWGTTFMAIAPEHPVIDDLVRGTKYERPAKKFSKKLIADKLKDPTNIGKKKEGFFLGRYAINHLTGKRVALYIANFAVYDYGTGIVKCTGAHDQRDFEFARKYDIDILPVIVPENGKKLNAKTMKQAYAGEGTMINAGTFTGMKTGPARKAIGEHTVKQGNGAWATQYKLRDWVFSRQRYWGEPIPMVHCEKCDWVPVPEKDLPVKLPKVDNYKPTEKGDSPLAAAKNWVKTTCPRCKGKAERETDVMPNWAGSNWYYLRYVDPKNTKTLAAKKEVKYWMPVDWYNGGMEHTTLHVLYSRFIYKFLWDIGAVPRECGSEPYAKRTSHGMVLGEGGIKMSKSKGNVVNPDDVVAADGADTMRTYEMFMGPFEQMIPWDTKGMKGVRRFLEKVWVLGHEKSGVQKTDPVLKKQLHVTIRRVSEDVEQLKFNTAVSALMEFANTWQVSNGLDKKDYQDFLALLSIFASHCAEELWEKAGYKGFCAEHVWPHYDEKLLQENTVRIVVQVNGKVRDIVEAALDTQKETLKKEVLSRPKIKKWLTGKKVKKVIVVKNKLVNIVL